VKVLLVDDEYDKAQSVVGVLQQLKLAALEIKHETTAHAARLRLRAEVFDLLLIDLHLPETLGAPPSPEGGLAFFDLLTLDTQVHLPTDVMFVTAREELVAEASQKVLARGAVLFTYSASSEQWRDIVVSRTKYVARRLSGGIAGGRRVDVAIVTALMHPELEAVLKLPYGWKQSRVAHDPTSYYLGELQRGSETVSFVAASAQRKGMPSSAALAAKLTLVFRPRYLVMLGICAGIEGKANFGDVIVADPTWDWGSGKHACDSTGSPVFLAAPYQMPLSPRISGLAQELSHNEAVRAAMRTGWKGPVPAGSLEIHIGPMASGAGVIAERSQTAAVVGQNRDVLGIEMEAYAVMSAAEYSLDPKPIAVVIKAVCDFADPNKSDHWQEYAAYNSAAFADQLFRSDAMTFGR